MEKPSKGKRIAHRLFFWTLMAVFFAVFAFSAYRIYDYYRQENACQSVNRTMTELATQIRPDLPPPSQEETEEPVELAPITVDFALLKEQYPGVVAWLYCPDSNIHYPVAQSDDNDYYLRHLPDGSWNVAGTLFLDFRCAGDFSDGHSVIYGHNMKNGSMFGKLKDYTDQAYYEAHPVWYLLTPEQNYKVVLFAGHITDSGSEVYELGAVPDAQTVARWQENSYFKTDVTVRPDQKILTLSTCSYEFQGARFVLEGVLQEIG